MPVAVAQEDRAVRHDPVEVFAARRAAGEIGHRPAAAADPALARVARGIGRDRFEVGLAAGDAVELAAQLGQTAMDRVYMRILETRRDGPTGERDDAGPRPDVRGDRPVRADRHDPPVANGDGRRPTPGGIHRRHATTGQGEIGGCVHDRR